mgnify:CR=1 FL=1
MTVNENYYEVPTEFTELSNNEYYKVFHDETYKKQLNIKIKNIPITNVYEFMKENLDLSEIKLDTSTILDAIEGITPFNNKEEQKDIISLIEEYGFKYASK